VRERHELKRPITKGRSHTLKRKNLGFSPAIRAFVSFEEQSEILRREKGRSDFEAAWIARLPAVASRRISAHTAGYNDVQTLADSPQS
jgi:hypothetical protein